MVRDGEVNMQLDETVEVIDARDGYVRVKKADGSCGRVPNYYLTIHELPGATFADQIEYRRKWYECVDEIVDGSSSAMENLDVVLELSKSERPVIVEELADLEVVQGQRVELSPSILSTVDFTVCWRGPAVESKRARIQTNNKATRLVIEHANSDDTGVYSIIARNAFGVTSSVAFVQVISPPEAPGDIDCRIIGEHQIRIKWKQEGCWKYCIEYRCVDEPNSNGFEIASTNIEKAHVRLRNFAGDRYEFRIFAYNQRVRSDASKVVRVDFRENVVR